MKGPRKSPTSAPAYVAIVCWLDLLGYGGDINKAGFDPAHPLAKAPLSRLRAFQRIVAQHSSSGFPTLVMNDGAVAYSNVELSRSDKVWRFIERCWTLYQAASKNDQASSGPGLRGVIAVGLRAKGSNRGILAQDQALTEILDGLADGTIDAARARADARKIRRVFDIVPQLQANFAFTRAYEAEQSGAAGGFTGPNLFLDTMVFNAGVPDWMTAGPAVIWTPRKTSFVALSAIAAPDDEVAHQAFRPGAELLERLSYRGPHINAADPPDPSLYKYASFETARIVLGSGRLRWTSPPLLNDPYDLSFDLHMDIDAIEVRRMAIDLLRADFQDDSRPAPQALFELWKERVKAEQPRLSRADFDRLVGPIVEASIARADSIAEMNLQLKAHLQRAKLLCLSETPTNMLMWSHYGQQHQGAVLRFSREGDDNAFSTARPVKYARQMPRFADSVAFARMITGRLQDPKQLSDSQIYTKAIEWSYEREWRIQFGFGRNPDAPFEDLRFGDEQLTGVILGYRMPDSNRIELAALALQRNSDVRLMHAKPAGREFAMVVEPWSPPDQTILTPAETMVP